MKKGQLEHKLYSDALKAAAGEEDPLLWECYVSFLIRNKEIINALHHVSLFKPKNYFGVVAQRKMEAAVKFYLLDVTSHLRYEKEYVYALEYDEQHLRLALMIHDILKAKISFWSEANREVPLMARLQTLGAFIVRQMHATNLFFCKEIREYEHYLNIFDSTVMYGMYLLSTTNFKDYSEAVIKNTSKRLEEIQIYENNATETFVIRAVAESKEKTFTMVEENLLTDLQTVEL